MEFFVVATVQTFYKIHPTNNHLFAKGLTHMGLDMSDWMNKSEYFSAPNVYNEKGCALFMQAAIDGLVGNLHLAHQKGWWDSAAMLRHIIAELTDGFAKVPGNVGLDVSTIKANAPVDQQKK